MCLVLIENELGINSYLQGFCQTLEKVLCFLYLLKKVAFVFTARLSLTWFET